MRSNTNIHNITPPDKRLSEVSSSFKTNNERLIHKTKLNTSRLIEFFGQCFKRERYNDKVSISYKYECKICTEREANIIFLPCGHVSVCKYCASTLNKCPICRVGINQIVQLYFS